MNTLTYKTGPGVRVNLEQLIASRMLIQANSGGGKSRAIRQLLEETYGKVQHIVIDPEGEFHTLREKFGYILAAKTGGDTLASPKTAKVLCRRLMELGGSAVLDLYELTPPDRREFVRIFLTEMTGLPKSLWRPCLVVIDEAHAFAPERGHGESVSTDAVINFISLARKRGFCPILATQRISKLHKDAAAELNNKMIGRTGLDVDVDRAAKELGFDKEKRQTLPRLEPGQFYVYGPAISPQVAIVATGDVTTTHPQAGQVSAAPPPPPAKIKAMLAQLGDLPKEAEEEARTLADQQRVIGQLRTEIRKLERDGKTIEKPVIDQGAIDAAVQRAVQQDRAKSQKLIDGMLRSLAAQSKAIATIPVTIERVQREIADIHEVFESANPVPLPGSPVRTYVEAPRTGPTARAAYVAKAQRSEPVEGVGKTGARILAALAFYESVGKTSVAPSRVAAFVGMSTSGGSWGARLSELRKAGLIVTSTGSIELTDEGRAIADTSGNPTSLEELHDQWRAKLGGSARRMLDVLLAAYPASVTRDELGAAVEMDTGGGSFGARLSEIRSPGLLDDKAPRGELRASDVLFPEGLS